MDIRPVEICPLVWWVQIWNVWFQPPRLCEMQSRWSDYHCMCGSHHEAWRRCDGVGCFAGDTVCEVFRIQATLNQHGCHSILQRYSIPSGLHLVWLSFAFQQDNDPKPPDCVRAVWPGIRVMDCCIRWPGLHNHTTSTQLIWFGMSWTAEWRKISQQALSICGNSF